MHHHRHAQLLKRQLLVPSHCRHVSTGSELRSLLERRPDDVVVTFAQRTAMCKAHKGAFKDTSSDALLYKTLAAVRDLCDFDPDRIQDIVVGTCHPPSPVYEARAAALVAGFSQDTPVQAINRLCSSGLMAIRSISNAITSGDIDIGLAVGYESMSKNPRPTPVFGSLEIRDHQLAKDCAEPMGWTSEMLAVQYSITREEMDKLALTSHTRASNAQRSGKFEGEIMPIKVSVTDADSINFKTIEVRQDDGLRHGTTLEGLSKLRAAFPDWGKAVSTGGNSSQLTDGAATTILMRRSTAEKLNVPILAKHVATSVVGVSPRIMGVGPVPAIKQILVKTGLRKEDVDLFEINEAFSSMYAYCLRELDLDLSRVNVNGGAIAFGHPLGATGVRQVVTGLSELRRREGRILCTSMCVGSGMGAAAIFINERTRV